MRYKLNNKEIIEDNNLIDMKMYNDIKFLIENARKNVYSYVNSTMVKTYWSIGKTIIQYQGGNETAEYGESTLKQLSKMLTEEYGKGFDTSNLRNMRKFYLTFQNCDAASHNLSWTHYRFLMRIENEEVRNFYINECIQNHWSTRQLERQINSFYYERLLSSQDKETVKGEIKTLEPNITPKDIIKDPFVLEFLNLKENKHFLERDLEQSLIDNLQEFLLELGKGFSFVGRQQRIDVDEEHYYIDLVFYNYILKCFVLIDLKTGKLTHQDIGQMDFYVRYYEDNIKQNGDNPTIGIVLCSEKSDAIVRYSVLEDNKNLFASKYMLYLPTEEELKAVITKEREFLEEETSLDD